MTSSNQPEWLNEFLSGHFEKLPDPVTWADNGLLVAAQIDGYKLSGGLDALSARVREFWFHDHRSRYVGISAEDLWLALFFESRAERFRSRFLPNEYSPDEDHAVDALCAAFRAAVIRIPIVERDEFLRRLIRSR
jgi:hypothetical protein